MRHMGKMRTGLSTNTCNRLKPSRSFPVKIQKHILYYNSRHTALSLVNSDYFLHCLCTIATMSFNDTKKETHNFESFIYANQQNGNFLPCHWTFWPSAQNPLRNKDPHTIISNLLHSLWRSRERVSLLHFGPERLRPQKQHHDNHCERQRLVLCSEFSITQQNIRVTLTQWAGFSHMEAQSHVSDTSDSSSQQTWHTHLNLQELCKMQTQHIQCI